VASFGAGQGGLVRSLVLLALLMLLAAALAQTIPVATGIALSSLVPEGDAGNLAQFGVALAGVAALRGGAEVALALLRQRVETRLSAALVLAVWDRILRLTLPLLTRHSVGEIASREGSLLSLAAGLRGFGFGAAMSLAVVAGSLVMIAVLSPDVALLAAAVAGLHLVVANRRASRRRAPSPPASRSAATRIPSCSRWCRGW
jgi:ABC-type bacteriocin/lantibiotic exporter with double-glycine peptidase domain